MFEHVFCQNFYWAIYCNCHSCILTRVSCHPIGLLRETIYYRLIWRRGDFPGSSYHSCWFQYPPWAFWWPDYKAAHSPTMWLLVFSSTDYSYSDTGGTNDAVIACCIITDSRLNVSVMNVGLSDHHLLTSPLPGRKMTSVSQTVRCHPWRQLDVTQSTSVKASHLCQCTMWPDDIDNVDTMYESEISDHCYSAPSYSIPRSHGSSYRLLVETTCILWIFSAQAYM